MTRTIHILKWHNSLLTERTKQGKRETLFCPKSVAFWRRWKPCLPWSNISPLVLLLLLLLRLLLFPKAFWPRKIILKALCLKAKRNVCKVRFSSVRLRRARQMFMISSSLAMWCQAIFSHSEWHRALRWCWEEGEGGNFEAFFLRLSRFLEHLE